MASTVWKGHITFGLVSFPVKMFTAARGETVSFNQLHKTDHSRVKQVLFCATEDKPIQRSEIVKGFEYEKDRYVIVDDEDLKKIQPPSAKVMEILEFVKVDQVDPVFFESSYYLAPDEAGEKPYSLFFTALQKSGYVGVAKITMHSREHIVVLRPGKFGLLMHTMYFADEVRRTDEFRTDLTLVKDKEMTLAMTLIDTLAADFEPEKYKDTYRESVRAMIDAKVKGEEIVAPAAYTPSKVVDILTALQQSLDRIKKPASTATTATGEAMASEAPAKPKRRSKAG
ncbi:MAG: Ku protein [Bryobacteraceae bacterium]